MSEKHIEEHLDLYTEGKITTSQRRILMTQWCGEAWSQVDHDSVARGLKRLESQPPLWFGGTFSQHSQAS